MIFKILPAGWKVILFSGRYISQIYSQFENISGDLYPKQIGLLREAVLLRETNSPAEFGASGKFDH